MLSLNTAPLNTSAVAMKQGVLHATGAPVLWGLLPVSGGGVPMLPAPLPQAWESCLMLYLRGCSHFPTL